MKKHIRRLIALGLTAAIVLSLAACGSTDTVSRDASDTASGSETDSYVSKLFDTSYVHTMQRPDDVSAATAQGESGSEDVSEDGRPQPPSGEFPQDGTASQMPQGGTPPEMPQGGGGHLPGGGMAFGGSASGADLAYTDDEIDSYSDIFDNDETMQTRRPCAG